MLSLARTVWGREAWGTQRHTDEWGRKEKFGGGTFGERSCLGMMW